MQRLQIVFLISISLVLLQTWINTCMYHILIYVYKLVLQWLVRDIEIFKGRARLVDDELLHARHSNVASWTIHSLHEGYIN